MGSIIPKLEPGANPVADMFSLLIHATRYGLNHGRGFSLHLKEVNFPDYENHHDSCSEVGDKKNDGRDAQQCH